MSFLGLFLCVYSAQAFELDGIAYAIVENNATVVSSETPYSGDIVIPGAVAYGGKTYEVTVIGMNAFSDCVSLSSVTLSEGLKTIKSSAFKGCSALSSIAFPKSLYQIEEQAFFGCSSLSEIKVNLEPYKVGSFTLGVIEASEAAFDQGTYSTATLKVPEGGLTPYSNNATFGKFETITTFSNPLRINSVLYSTPLDNGTISVMPSIIPYEGHIVIPSTVVYEGSTYMVTTIMEDAFSNCRNLASVTLPEGLTSIGQSAFSNSSITSINLPSTLSSFGWYAFSGSDLATVTIPGSVTKILRGVFQDCTKLTEVVFSEGLDEIREFAFRGCSSLSQIVFPKSLSAIQWLVFSGCSSLSSIEILKEHHSVIEGTPMGLLPVADDAFDESTYENATLIVPVPSYEYYSKDSVWKKFATISIAITSSPEVAGEETNLILSSPSAGTLIIQSASSCNVVLSDINGKQFPLFSLQAGENTISGLPSGCYLVNGQKVWVY